MKRILIIFILLLFVLSAVYSQKYDLLVRSNGDSIACRIDSITSTHVYFHMKSRGYWVYTGVNKNQISEVKREVIDLKSVYLKPGTSFITYYNQEEIPKASMKELRVNSLVLATDFLFSITLSYERLMPLDNNTGLMLRGGAGMSGESGNEVVIMGQLSFLAGNKRHFFEAGSGYYQTFNYYPSFFPLIGYRYMGYKGIMVKLFVKIEYYTDPGWVETWGQGNVWPGLQIGYRFWL